VKLAVERVAWCHRYNFCALLCVMLGVLSVLLFCECVIALYVPTGVCAYSSGCRSSSLTMPMPTRGLVCWPGLFALQCFGLGFMFQGFGVMAFVGSSIFLSFSKCALMTCVQAG